MSRRIMRSPPLVPEGFDFETYIVLDDSGNLAARIAKSTKTTPTKPQ